MDCGEVNKWTDIWRVQTLERVRNGGGRQQLRMSAEKKAWLWGILKEREDGEAMKNFVAEEAQLLGRGEQIGGGLRRPVSMPEISLDGGEAEERSLPFFFIRKERLLEGASVRKVFIFISVLEKKT